MTAILCAVLLLAQSARGQNEKEFKENAKIACDDVQYEGWDIIVNGATVTIDCDHEFASLSVINGGSITHTAGGTVREGNPPVGVHLIIEGDFAIDSNSAVNVSGRGYPKGSGPGKGKGSCGCGCTYSGAGHGGNGGATRCVSGGMSYGSIEEPIELGSGSVHVGGGGAVRFSVGGTLTLDGSILAAGTGSGGGSGAGGSIYITARIITGNGNISANGGSNVSPQGGGGGGRIAIYANDMHGFQGGIGACGGSGYQFGGAGTVYVDAEDRVGPQLI